MKKIFVFLLLIVFLFITFTYGYSINIDGYDTGIEWADSEPTLLLKGESNCKVNFGLMKYHIDSATNNIFFCFMFKEPDLAEDNTNVGLSIKIENSDFYMVNILSSSNEINEDRYSFDGAVSIDSNEGVTCEIKFGLKFGLPDKIDGCVRFYDSDGVPSNIYSFTVDNTEEITEEQRKEYYNSSKTTAVKTTVVKTTVETTITTQKQETTKSKNKKTTQNTTSNSNDFWLLDMILDDLASLKTETSTVTSLKNTETKSKTKTSKVTNPKLHTTVPEIISESIEINIESSLSETIVGYVTNNTSLGLKKGDKYKTITLIAGAITIIVIASLGTIKSRKENENK